MTRNHGMVSLLFLHPNGTVAFKMPGSLVHGNLRVPPSMPTHPENKTLFLGRVFALGGHLTRFP